MSNTTRAPHGTEHVLDTASKADKTDTDAAADRTAPCRPSLQKHFPEPYSPHARPGCDNAALSRSGVARV